MTNHIAGLKVGDRVEGWCPKSRCWVKVSVDRVSAKSFQGTDKHLEKWTGLTQWREPSNSPNLTSVPASGQASLSPDCNSVSTSLDSARTISTAATSSASDTLDAQSLEISSIWTGQISNTAASLMLTSSQPRHHASLSQSRESVKEPMTSEIVSPPSSERSQQCSPDFSALRTCPDYLAALLNPDGQVAHTLKSSLELLNKSATGGKNFLSAADTLDRPSLESGYFWLESPGGLSSTGEGRPPGQTRLESFLRENGLLNKGEVLDPATLSDWYNIPKNWLDPLEFRAAAELLEAREQQLEIFSILESPPSPSVESCTCHHSVDGCEACGWFTTVRWNERDGWGDEPLDPDDVWRIGDRVRWRKGLQQFGTVQGLQQQELLGGKLPLIVVRWDGFDSDVLIPAEQLWRVWNTDRAQPKTNSPEPTRKRSPKGTRQPGRCDKGQANPSGRIELQTKHKKLSSGELKTYEYNLYRYQLGGRGKVY
ncbi:hypothetical protein NC994_22195 [Trichocoleus sp. AS-A1]